MDPKASRSAANAASVEEPLLNVGLRPAPEPRKKERELEALSRLIYSM